MTRRVELASNAAASSWEDITDLVYLETARWGGTADYGAIDTGSGFDLRDDDGTRAVLPWRRRVRLIETATTPDTVMWQGRIVGDETARGVIKTGDAKQFDVSLVDVNADFGGVDTLNNHRDAETDVERIQSFFDVYWGSGQTRPSSVFGDTYFSTSNPVNLAKHTYTGVPFIDLFNHIVETSNKQFFLTREYDLFYDLPTSTAYAAGISITDVSPNYTTSFPPGQPRAVDDATEFYSGIRFRLSNNRVVRLVRSVVEAANDQWRTTVIDESVTSTSVATSRANAFLDLNDHAHSTFYCHVDLPSDKVDLLSWGMTISARAAAWGILSPTTLRVARLSWELLNDTTWRAHLELGLPTKFGRRATTPAGGGSSTPPVVGPTPFIPGQDAALIDVNLSVGSAAYGAGDRSIHYASQVGASLPTAVPGNEYRLVFDQTSSFVLPPANYSFIDGANLDIWETAEGPTRADDWAPSNIYPYLADGPYTPGKHWETDWLEWTGAAVALDISIGGTMISGFYGGLWAGRLQLQMRVPGGGASDPGDDPIGYPSAGQPVIEPIGSDGTTTPGSPTPYAYAPGSLVIIANGVDMTYDITEVDPDTGEYELETAIPEGAEIIRRYLGTGTGLL